jgi:hypothetical protein
MCANAGPLACNDSEGFERYYAAAEGLVKEIGARPHLGKFCEGFGKEDMARLHGDSFERFLELVEEHDPERKFLSRPARGKTRLEEAGSRTPIGDSDLTLAARFEALREELEPTRYEGGEPFFERRELERFLSRASTECAR